jgi:hypothetical protein
MDGFREFGGEHEPAYGSHAVEPAPQPEPRDEASERRMQVKAYNYWTSLLDGRDFPSIEDLEPADIADFAKHSVLLDFTSGPASANAAYLGAALRRECDMDADNDSLADVPRGSILARTMAYYPQILENRAPIGIEEEFANQRGLGRIYRGILMPFSSDGDTIDFVYGVFNWSDSDVAPVVEPVAEARPEPEQEDVLELGEHFLDLDSQYIAYELPADEEEQALELTDPADKEQAFELTDRAEAAVEPVEPVAQAEPTVVPIEETELAEEPLAEAEFAVVPMAEAEQPVAGEAAPEDTVSEPRLADFLLAARATAEDAKAADGRSRQALYGALAQAYDFSCVADDSADDYAQLLEEAGVVVQARAPMTAVAKLVFGTDYDKARLTEYAAALAFAARSGVERGAFGPFIDAAEGGLKGLVEAERRFRRPDGQADGGWREQAVTRLRSAEARSLDSLAGNGEFALVLVRRDATGDVAPIAAVSDPALLDKALKKAAR